MGKQNNSFIFCRDNISVKDGQFKFEEIKLVWRTSRSKNAIPVLINAFGDGDFIITRDMIFKLMSTKKQFLLHTNMQELCQKLCSDLKPNITLTAKKTEDLSEENKGLLGPVLDGVNFVIVLELS